jgi:undecaprenyl phosphate-alpha-L-ara4N flippase subunit ArnE
MFLACSPHPGSDCGSLSKAFPILGLQFALIPLASARYLDERIAWMQWGGIAVIALGVALVGQT